MLLHDFENMLSVRLGGNLIDVELEPSDYKVAFDLAKLTYKTKASNNTNQQFLTLTTQAGVLTYPVPADTQIITKIIKARDAFGLTGDEPFDILIANQLIAGGSGGSTSMVSFELASQVSDMWRRYTAQDATFTHNRYTNTITLHKRPTGADVWLLEAYMDVSDDQYRDMLWIQNYALAECKIILGRAYSKFSALSSPTGETSLDGLSLVAEGQEDKLTLLEEIKNFVDGTEQQGISILMG